MAEANGSAQARVALVHDFLVDVRGAERVFLALCGMFPEADLFTAVYDERGTEGRFAHRRVNTSFLQALRPNARTFRSLLPLYPSAMESLDLRGYDLVLSSSSAWAHGVIPAEGAVHVCYCHNPFRYAWNARAETLADRGPLGRAALGVIFQRWRQWDWIAAQRVDAYVANSETTRRRVARYFGRDASVLHPPVETARFAPGPVGDAYVVLSELMPHKRIDVAVRAFNALRRPLVVVGNGPDYRRLRRLAGPAVTFTGRVSDAEAAALLASARALVVTATEEFGIAAVEAQAAGRPVVALAEGGVCETVIEGRTGTFYAAPDPAALAAAVRRFDALAVDPAACVENAARFDVGHFRHGLRAVVDRAVADERRTGPPRRRSPRRPAGLAWQA
jgi:glycosyltransferase involved in cell wall biosynthesis